MGEYADYELEKVIERFERRAEQRAKPKGEKKFVCKCGKRFSTQQGMSDHEKAVHPSV